VFFLLPAIGLSYACGRQRLKSSVLYLSQPASRSDGVYTTTQSLRRARNPKDKQCYKIRRSSNAYVRVDEFLLFLLEKLGKIKRSLLHEHTKIRSQFV
jgi:hypothetical protein